MLRFSDDDYAGVSLPNTDALVVTLSSLPHTDVLVVTLAIADHKIHWILVDIGNSTDILYQSAFELIKIDRERMILSIYHLVGF